MRIGAIDDKVITAPRNTFVKERGKKVEYMQDHARPEAGPEVTLSSLPVELSLKGGYEVPLSWYTAAVPGNPS